MKISAVIIAKNEAAKIRDAISSLAFADEILLIDSESTDETVAVAESMGARVIIHPWMGFSKQKQLGVDSATNDWILSIDADERVSPELRHELENFKENPEEQPVAFSIPRLSFYLGRPILHCGWYPDRQIRFFNRNHARWNGRTIHESIEADGKIGKLSGNIFHYSVDDSSHHHRMIGERYAPMSALASYEAGKKGSLLKILTAPVAAFIRNYFLKAGFADGLSGFAICWFSAHHAFLKNLILWELSSGIRQPQDIHETSQGSRIES